MPKRKSRLWQTGANRGDLGSRIERPRQAQSSRLIATQTRRSFLEQSLIAAGKWTALPLAVTGTVAAGYSLVRDHTYEQEQFDQRVRRCVAVVFDGCSDGYEAFPAFHNPQNDLSPKLTPPTKYASDVLQRKILELDSGRIDIVEPSSPFSGEDNVLLFGSPSSNLYARELFGFDNDLVDPGDSLSGFRRIADIFPLPVQYVLDAREIIHRHNQWYPHHRDRRRYIPNWGLHVADSDQNRESYRWPGRGNNGSMESDYLLITCLPNLLSADSGLYRKVVTIGGTHAIGTKAVELLFTDAGILAFENLADDITSSGAQYWQAIVKVSDIRPDQRSIYDDTEYQYGHRISDAVEFFKVDVDFERSLRSFHDFKA